MMCERRLRTTSVCIVILCWLAIASLAFPPVTQAQVANDSIRVDPQPDGTVRISRRSQPVDPRLGFRVQAAGLVVGPDGAFMASEYFRVDTVIADSPAGRAGLQVGDQILEVNGRNGRHLPFLPRRHPGTEYELTVRRRGQLLRVILVVGEPHNHP